MESSEESLGLQFPCVIDVKIFIKNIDQEELHVKDFVTQHLGREVLQSWQVRPSTSAKYLAITAAVKTPDRAHIDMFYQALCDYDRVIMAI